MLTMLPTMPAFAMPMYAPCCAAAALMPWFTSPAFECRAAADVTPYAMMLMPPRDAALRLRAAVAAYADSVTPEDATPALTER